MEPIDFLKILRHRWKIIALCGIVAAAAAWFTTPAIVQGGPSVTSYTATATMLQQPGSTTPLDFVAVLAQGGGVPQIAAKTLGYSGNPAVLASEVSVTADTTLGTLTVSSSGEKGQPTADLVNAYAEAIQTSMAQQDAAKRKVSINQTVRGITDANQNITIIKQQLASQPNNILLQAKLTAYTQLIQTLTSELVTLESQSVSGSGLTVYQKAVPIPVVSGGFSAPSSRHGRVLLGLGVGLLLGVVLALIIDRMDTRLRRRQDVEEAYELTVVAEVPKLTRRERRRGRVVTLSSPAAVGAEAYRGLRSALTLMPSQPLALDTRPVDPDAEKPLRLYPPQVVLITSARAGEGKSTTAANLAVTLAETGKRVLLLDADFRAPSLHALLDVAPGTGVADLLTAPAGTDVVGLARPTGVAGVRLVTAGNAGAFHGALPSRVGEMVAEARQIADMVIIDSAPLLVGNDALDFMPFVDTTIVVARLGKLRDDQARRAAGLLARMRVPVVGLTLIGVHVDNAAAGKRLGSSGRGYGYGYGGSSSSAGHGRRSKAKRGRAT
jgi:Mrp family chromosome partitioning ATPase